MLAAVQRTFKEVASIITVFFSQFSSTALAIINARSAVGIRVMALQARHLCVSNPGIATYDTTHLRELNISDKRGAYCEIAKLLSLPS